MKLAKIDYTRCSEWDGYSLVWVPDGWTQDDFEAAVSRAESAYLAFLKRFDDDAEPPVAKAYGQPPYKDFPDLKVAEVQALWDEQKRAYAEWERDHSKGRKGFPAFLAGEGIEAIHSHEPELVTEVDWGHRHGVRLDYEAKPVTVHRLVRADGTKRG